MSRKRNDSQARLLEHLKELRLPAMRAQCKELSETARREGMGYEEYLLALCEAESQVRREHRVERLLRASRLPAEKNLAALDLGRFGRSVGLQVRTLLEGGFLDRKENVLAFGKPGSGKTHLLCAVGQELVHAGRSIRFTTCCRLVQELLRAKQELGLDRQIKRLAKFDGLIVDDIGYVEQDREEMEVLFTLLAERYERGSILLTSNLPFSKWERIFKDPMTTAAAIDRLVHHSVILELNIDSYRMEEARKNKEGGTQP